MLGFRGCRLGIVHPSITRMQAQAILEAAAQVAAEERGKPEAERSPPPRPKIMIPLVGCAAELAAQIRVVEQAARDVFEGGGGPEKPPKVEFEVGTMIVSVVSFFFPVFLSNFRYSFLIFFPHPPPPSQPRHTRSSPAPPSPRPPSRPPASPPSSASAATTSRRRRSASRATTPRRASCRRTWRRASSPPTPSPRSTKRASASSSRSRSSAGAARTRSSRSASAASTAGTPSRSPSSTRAAFPTCRAARCGSRWRGWLRRRRRSRGGGREGTTARTDWIF